MYIKELQVDNFKSFANDMTIPFLKGFTTISGPNGSGKSNIIDSILFALGLASARNLRTDQLSDFISTHTKRNEAFVKVVFEPTWPIVAVPVEMLAVVNPAISPKLLVPPST